MNQSLPALILAALLLSCQPAKKTAPDDPRANGEMGEADKALPAVENSSKNTIIYTITHKASSAESVIAAWWGSFNDTKTYRRNFELKPGNCLTLTADQFSQFFLSIGIGGFTLKHTIVCNTRKEDPSNVCRPGHYEIQDFAKDRWFNDDFRLVRKDNPNPLIAERCVNIKDWIIQKNLSHRPIQEQYRKYRRN